MSSLRRVRSKAGGRAFNGVFSFRGVNRSSRIRQTPHSDSRRGKTFKGAALFAAFAKGACLSHSTAAPIREPPYPLRKRQRATAPCGFTRSPLGIVVW